MKDSFSRNTVSDFTLPPLDDITNLSCLKSDCQYFLLNWWRLPDSNWGHKALQASALPTELKRHALFLPGGAYRIRTDDLFHAMEAR